MQLTMPVERMRELVLEDVLNKEDRDDIYRICLTACDREMAKMKREEN